MKIKLKNRDRIKTIFGEEAVIVNIGKDMDELTKLDRQIKTGYYADGGDCINQFIVTGELYDIVPGGGER